MISRNPLQMIELILGAPDSDSRTLTVLQDGSSI